MLSFIKKLKPINLINQFIELVVFLSIFSLLAKIFLPKKLDFIPSELIAWGFAIVACGVFLKFILWFIGSIFKFIQGFCNNQILFDSILFHNKLLFNINLSMINLLCKKIDNISHQQMNALNYLAASKGWDRLDMGKSTKSTDYAHLKMVFDCIINQKAYQNTNLEKLKIELAQHNCSYLVLWLMDVVEDGEITKINHFLWTKEILDLYSDNVLQKLISKGIKKIESVHKKNYIDIFTFAIENVNISSSYVIELLSDSSFDINLKNGYEFNYFDSLFKYRYDAEEIVPILDKLLSHINYNNQKQIQLFENNNFSSLMHQTDVSTQNTCYDMIMKRKMAIEKEYFENNLAKKTIILPLQP